MKSLKKIFLIYALFVLGFAYSNASNMKSKNLLRQSAPPKAGAAPVLKGSNSSSSNSTAPASNSTTPNGAKTDGPDGIPLSLRSASYVDLVVNTERPLCPETEDPRLAKKKLDNLPSDDYYPAQGPKRKPNPFKIMDSAEFMHINYLFDYLDQFLIKKQGKTFMQIVVQEFKKMYESAKAMKKEGENHVLDPYTPEKLLFYYSNGAAGKEPFTDSRIKAPNLNDIQVVAPPDAKETENTLKMITAFNKNFNIEVWKKGIAPIQILNLMKQWLWIPSGEQDIMDAKQIVDKFDFDGDGALNPSEFIAFAITHNMKQVHQCRQFCFKDIIDNIIDPLFMYLDCDNDGYINSENMWGGLRNINRVNKNYNMYSCVFPKEMNKNYRTNSVNDFILKHSKIADGFLNTEELRTGLLMGIWERQVSESDIFESSDKSNKSIRWENDGAKDVECEKIKAFFPKNSGMYNSGLPDAMRRRR